MRRSRRSLAVLLVVGTAALAAHVGALADAGSNGPPTAIGTGGAAASVDVLATRAAVDTLRHGGNAVDAAVAAAAVLGVTEPFSCGIGGGGFMVLYQASDGKVTTIDGRETAPAAMRPDSFWENGKPLPFNDARYSGLSVGVPGTVETWDEALKRYGTISLADALGAGIRVAREGFVVDQTFFDQTRDNVDWFDDIPASAALYLDPDGTPHDVGTVFRNPELASTYERIAHLGAKGFYRGAVADALVNTVQRPVVSPTANHIWRPGLMTMRDLHTYTAPERAPTHLTYRGLDVYGMGPPSSGGSTVGEALNILEGYPLSTMTREAALHYFLEASRYSFADRGAYLADPAYFDVPLTGLLSDQFAATRRALITGTPATSPVAPGDPYPFNGGGGAVQASASETRVGTTTHITTADRWGDVVTYTFTIESTGGAGLVVPGFGFLANNELTDFNYDSLTHPNRVEGGKRPRSSMSPTIVMHAGQPLLAVGSPGGSTIITTVLQILIDRLDLGLTLPQAIADPRLTQRNTATTQAEPAFLSTAEAAALRTRGHVFSTNPEIGAATGIEFLGGDRLLAAAEPVRRGGGSAMVVNPSIDYSRRVEQTKFLLDESQLPRRWYNVVADMPNPPQPVLHPGTGQPVGPDDLAPLFPMALIMQEVSEEAEIAIPEEILDIYSLWRPTPLYRARRLEQAAGTKSRIFYKYEGVSPPGSHKPNTAVAQAYYNKQEGRTRLSTETGAGQWGSALAFACKLLGLECKVYMVRISYEQKPFRRSMIQLWGAEIVASPSKDTQSGRAIIEEFPDTPGSLGIAISEAVEDAAQRDDTSYSLGSVLNHVLLHQTVIGQEAIAQMELAGAFPDVVIGCVGGGSNFAGLAFPFIREKIAGREIDVLACEPAACPTLTRGLFAYDFGDTSKLTPLVPMHTLGHDFVPAPIHAGGLRYHGVAPLISQLVQDGLIRAEAYLQSDVFAAAILFANSEGIIPAPESSHAIHGAVEAARQADEAGEQRTILFNLSGHGHFDMAAYDNYLAGKLEDVALDEQEIERALRAIEGLPTPA